MEKIMKLDMIPSFENTRKELIRKLIDSFKVFEI